MSLCILNNNQLFFHYFLFLVSYSRIYLSTYYSENNHDNPSWMYREHKSIRQCIHFQVILYSNEKYSNLDIYLVNDVISILTVN